MFAFMRLHSFVDEIEIAEIYFFMMKAHFSIILR